MLAAGLAAPGFGVPARAAQLTPADLFGNPVIVKGRGFEIRQQELDDNYRALKSTLATQGQTIPQGQEAATRRRLLDRMILARVIDQRATPEDRERAKVAAEKFIADTKARALNEKSYERQLMAVGMTVEAFEKRAHEQALVEEVINREIRSTLTVSDAQMRAFYERGEDIRTAELAKRLAELEQAGQTDSAEYTQLKLRIDNLRKANLERLNQPERVRANLLLLYTVNRVTREPLPPGVRDQKRQLAEQLRDRLRQGADFTEIALQYSEDPDVQQTKGEYTAARNAPMDPTLREKLFTLPVGEISDVVEAGLGYYLIQVKERLPARKIPFEEAAPQIRELLLTQMVEQRLPDYFKRLKEEYDVEILRPEALE